MHKLKKYILPAGMIAVAMLSACSDEDFIAPGQVTDGQSVINLADR